VGCFPVKNSKTSFSGEIEFALPEIQLLRHPELVSDIGPRWGVTQHRFRRIDCDNTVRNLSQSNRRLSGSTTYVKGATNPKKAAERTDFFGDSVMNKGTSSPIPLCNFRTIEIIRHRRVQGYYIESCLGGLFGRPQVITKWQWDAAIFLFDQGACSRAPACVSTRRLRSCGRISKCA